MAGPDPRAQPGILAFSVHDPYEMAGSSKLLFATMLAALTDKAPTERNNIEKCRYPRMIRPSPAAAVHKVYGLAPAARKPVKYWYDCAAAASKPSGTAGAARCQIRGTDSGFFGMRPRKRRPRQALPSMRGYSSTAPAEISGSSTITGKSESRTLFGILNTKP